jgi:hypothetical protein
MTGDYSRTKDPSDYGDYEESAKMLFCIHEGTERTRDDVRLENFYYE